MLTFQAEALATQPPLPGVPLQIRNAPTKLMKKLGYGKEYSYDPNFAHPVYNVSADLIPDFSPFSGSPT
jgi:putative ATPase